MKVLKNQFKLISENDIQNLIFYGPAGTGKTYTSKIHC